MSERRVIVVRDGDNVFLRDLGGTPSPMLIDLCSDGRAHEAWANIDEGSHAFVATRQDCEYHEEGHIVCKVCGERQEEQVHLYQWRARDDAWDAKHKPADVPYVMVRVGLNPNYKEPWLE